MNRLQLKVRPLIRPHRWNFCEFVFYLWQGIWCEHCPISIQMPRSRLDDAANEVYLLEDLKSSPGQFERGIEYDIGEVDNSSRKRTQTRSVIGQLLSPFGFSAERSEGRFGFDDAPTLGPPRESRWTRSPREIRRFRPSVVLRCLRRVVFALPVLILIFLYVGQVPPRQGFAVH